MAGTHVSKCETWGTLVLDKRIGTVVGVGELHLKTTHSPETQSPDRNHLHLLG